MPLKDQFWLGNRISMLHIWLAKASIVAYGSRQLCRSELHLMIITNWYYLVFYVLVRNLFGSTAVLVDSTSVGLSVVCVSIYSVLHNVIFLIVIQDFLETWRSVSTLPSMQCLSVGWYVNPVITGRIRWTLSQQTWQPILNVSFFSLPPVIGNNFLWN